MRIENGDWDILRDLNSKLGNIAELTINKERRQMWEQLNDLHPCKPLVHIHEVP